ncbi:MAG TPA: sigma-70 family RNA polymerase sigma factor [Pirellulales bacterium]|jgi:RNA polymerase sigma-70 factor (ECF subfamily)|nr:sigma-70 family RNA polymerase sigma factor [Pirellulales bacterium]
MSLSRIWPKSAELEPLIMAARGGSQAALGRLLETCRDYLLLVANRELGRDLIAKVGGSDLVQETFVEAHKCFDHFQGRSDGELLGWLRRILLNKLLETRRAFAGTAKRDISREVSCDNDSSLRAAIESVPDSAETPSQQASAEERRLALYEALETIPGDYRQVIALRYWEGLTFEEIGQQMDRSKGAVHKLWLRAVDQLEKNGSWGSVEP